MSTHAREFVALVHIMLFAKRCTRVELKQQHTGSLIVSKERENDGRMRVFDLIIIVFRCESERVRESLPNGRCGTEQYTWQLFCSQVECVT